MDVILFIAILLILFLASMSIFIAEIAIEKSARDSWWMPLLFGAALLFFFICID